MYNIVYYSKYGHTKEYAEMLASELGVTAVSLKNAKKVLAKKEEVIFMTSLNNNRLNKLIDAKKLFDPKVICAVGISYYRDTLIELINIVNSNEDIPLFYLQGGFDGTKLNFMERLVFQTSMAQYAQRTDLSEEENKMLEMIHNPTNCVSLENLQRVICYLKNEPYIENIEEKVAE